MRNEKTNEKWKVKMEHEKIEERTLNSKASKLQFEKWKLQIERTKHEN